MFSAGPRSYLWVLLLFLALESAVPRLQAQEFDWGGSIRGYPFLRLEKLDLEEELGLSGPLARRDTELLILRLTGDVFFGQHLSLETHPLLEFASPSRLLGPAGLATSTAPTFLPLEHVFTDNPDVELIGSFDRLNLQVELNRVRIVIGRQAVTWGVVYFWPSLDLFAPFSPRRVDRDYKPGIDAVRATIPLGDFSEIEVIGAILGPSMARDGTLGALTRFNLGPLDWGLMGGKFHRDTVAGSFLTADAWGTGLRGEVTWTQSGDPEDRVRDRRTFWRAAVGVDRQLTPTFTLTAEFSFSAYGATEASDYLDWSISDRVLRGEINALGYPKAALFGFCMALASYNVLSVTKAAVAAAHGEEEAETLSTYYVADEISATYRGMMIVIPATYWTKEFADLTPSQMAKSLIAIARQINLKRYRKNPWTPKTRIKRKGKLTRQKHVSTARVLQKQNGKK